MSYQELLRQLEAMQLDKDDLENAQYKLTKQIENENLTEEEKTKIQDELKLIEDDIDELTLDIGIIKQIISLNPPEPEEPETYDSFYEVFVSENL